MSSTNSSTILQRKVLRSSVSKAITELDNAITARDVSLTGQIFAKLEEKSSRLFENDPEVLEYLSSQATQDETNKCGMSIRCVVCTKKHYPILCPTLCKDSDNCSFPETKTATNSVISNSCSGTADVLLQTLMIRVSGPSNTKVVRALCDSASQKSYIKRDLAEFLNLKIDHTEQLKHSLFGGIETEKTKHNVLKCELQEIRGNYKCEAVLLDKETICGIIPKINKSDAECFTKHGIYLSDSESNCSDISILLGADILGKLLTGSISQQPNGLTAVQTYLGWVVMGTTNTWTNSSNHAMPIISLHSGSKICDLWSLDVLGISDPAENKTKHELDTETIAFFEKTVIFEVIGTR
ncbi:hypothetical protein JTE90_005579 [Oedothorax gibbosus]|uniref:Peptidase aspartic putative domain-containing protein n=1 Tax=Oedothorax gibbosus TaxID=931172 RepID=A0AAV6VB19_9ARAC|nr:hypothetical protein JTE90_005579 [Oedothorax gibbosus]